MPESVTDRPSKSHEYLFLLTKSERYFYDQMAIGRPIAPATLKRYETGWNGNGERDYPDGVQNHIKEFMNPDNEKREWANANTVWNINTRPYKEAHFATFPQKLIEPCIKAGSSEKGCCPKCGKPWTRKVEDEKVNTRPGLNTGSGKSGTEEDPNASLHNSEASKFRQKTLVKTVGWEPGCDCAENNPIPCVVLDPFMGSGTTAWVARELNRAYIGFDLNPEYVKLAENKRLVQQRLAI